MEERVMMLPSIFIATFCLCGTAAGVIVVRALWTVTTSPRHRLAPQAI
jgi:hypothetical protein